MPAAVITRVSLHDDMSSKIDAMSAKFDTFASRTEKAFARASRGGVKFKSILGGILASELVMRGLAYLQYGIRGVTEEVINFDHYLTVASAQFEGLADKGTAGFARLEKSIRDISKRTQFTPTEVARAYENFAKAGFDLNDSLAATPALLDLATAADMNLEQTVEVASDTLFAFGLTVKDIQDPLRRAAALTSNLTRVSDVMAKAAIESTTDIEGMYEVLKQSGPVAKLAGVDIETWAAFATVMAQQSIKGSIAGTALKNIFQRMARPTKAAAAALKEIGVVPIDKNGKLRDFVDLFGELHDKLATLPDSKKVGVLYDLFGRHAVAGSAAAVSAAKALKEYQTMLRTSAKGTSGTMAEKIRGSLKNQLLMLRNQIYGIGIAIGEAFSKKFPDAFDRFKNWLTSIDPEKVADKIMYLVDKLVAMFAFIQKNWRWLLVLVVGMETLSIASKALAGAGALGAIVKVFEAATIGGMGFKAAILAIAGPTLVLTGLVAALAASLALLYMRWEETKEFWIGVFKDSEGKWYENAPGVRQIALAIKIFENWDTILKTVAGSIDAVISAFKRLARFLNPSFDAMQEANYRNSGEYRDWKNDLQIEILKLEANKPNPYMLPATKNQTFAPFIPQVKNKYASSGPANMTVFDRGAMALSYGTAIREPEKKSSVGEEVSTFGDPQMKALLELTQAIDDMNSGAQISNSKLSDNIAKLAKAIPGLIGPKGRNNPDNLGGNPF